MERTPKSNNLKQVLLELDRRARRVPAAQEQAKRTRCMTFLGW